MGRLFTIGHSNRTLDEFIELLRIYNIEAIVDVRSSPFSKFSPQFNKGTIQSYLRLNSVHYISMNEELGARRKDPEVYVGNRVSFDLVARLPIFKNGINRILTGVARMNVALMCSEKDPATCHRAILITSRCQVEGEIKHIIDRTLVETQAELDMRLLRECKLDEPDIFKTERERIVEAYAIRAAEIAFSESL